MSELQKFARECQEEILKKSDWLNEFHVEWIASDGHAKFRLKGVKRSAEVEWNGESFRLNIVGPDVVYYETSRSVCTAEQALHRVSAMLVE